MKKIIRLILAAAALGVAPCLRAQGLISDLTVQRTASFTGALSPAQITSNQNDYSPTGIGSAFFLRINSDAARNITGLAAGKSGEAKLVTNTGSFAITLVNASASSTAANRFALVENFVLAAGGSTFLYYDVTSARWRQVFGIALSSSGTVTSADVTMPTGFTKTGGPITTSGTIAFTTSLSGMLKGSSGAFTTGTAGTDYVAPGVYTTSGLTFAASARLFGRNTAGAGAGEELNASTAKTLLSLNLVENTALSTWTGSTNVATLGAIVTGVWNATAVGAAYGGTGLSSYSAGDMIYATGASSLAVVGGTSSFGRGLLTQLDAPTALATLGALFNTRVAKTGTYTVVAADKGVLFDTTSGTFTLNLTAAATLGNSFSFSVFNSGSGTITIDPNASETIRDATSSATTKALAQGEGGIVVCDGTGFLFLKVTTGGVGGGTGANPTAAIGLTAVNGSATTFLRSDGAPALDQSIAPTWTGVHSFTPAARSSGIAPYLVVTMPVDTGQTAGTEAIGVNFTGAIRTHASNTTITNQRSFVFGTPTEAFATAGGTITNAATVYIAQQPAAGTNATIANAYALWLGAGNIGIGTAGSVATIGQSSGALSLTSSGTNQNLNLQASGTGFIFVNANGANNASFALNSGSANSPLLYFEKNSVIKALLGMSNGTNNGITGSVTDDVFFRNDASQSFLISTDAGTSIGFKVVASTGQVLMPKNITSTSTASGTLVVTGGGAFGENIFGGGKIVTVSPTSGIGYATGAGGTVTQATSKATGATLNKVSGQITMNAAALANATAVSFTFTNSTIAATDVVEVTIASGGTVGAYLTSVTATGAGSCSITLYNCSGGSLSEAVVLNYAVIKAVTS